MTGTGRLTSDAVVPLLRGRFGDPYRWIPTCVSTQDAVREGDPPEGAVAVTEHQTGGRGRSGRAWDDVPGQSLLFSLLLRPPPGAPAEQLSLVAGLAVADAVDAATGVAAGVKWPNDVLLDGAKVAGILLEASRDAVVCGIGVNVNHPRAELPALTRLPATSLRAATGGEHDRADLLARLLESLERRYDAWLAAGLAPLLPELEARDTLRGRRLAVADESGIARGFGRDGRLELVRDDGTVVHLASGEVRELGAG